MSLHQRRAPLPEPDSVCTPGPWQHRYISVNGVRLHAADILPEDWESRHKPGELPHLVLFLHGYGENWWVWHHQLPGVAQAGYHAMAFDLRGYGDSDKPPRGYDLPGAAEDVVGLIRATGHRTATLVAHGMGGAIAWTAAHMYPETITEIITVSSPHPVAQLKHQLRHPLSHPQFSGPFFSAQLPRLPEYRMRGARWARNYFSSRTLDNWVESTEGQEVVSYFEQSLLIPKVAFCANEYLRWIGRSRFRPDGWSYYRRMSEQLPHKATLIYGTDDHTVAPEAMEDTRKYVKECTTIHILHTAFFPMLEQKEQFQKILIDILTQESTSVQKR